MILHRYVCKYFCKLLTLVLHESQVTKNSCFETTQGCKQGGVKEAEAPQFWDSPYCCTVFFFYIQICCTCYVYIFHMFNGYIILQIARTV